MQFLAYTGLRWGDATGFTVADVEVSRCRLNISSNAVIVNGHVIVGTPKTHERRTVVYPGSLGAAMAGAIMLKRPDELVFPAETSGYLRPGNSRSGWFAGACKRARLEDAADAVGARARGKGIRAVMPRVTPHDLWHTTASLAISAGANVKAVPRMLGHASAAMTLGTYSDLFDDDLDDVAWALQQARTTALRV